MLGPRGLVYGPLTLDGLVYRLEYEYHRCIFSDTGLFDILQNQDDMLDRSKGQSFLLGLWMLASSQTGA